MVSERLYEFNVVFCTSNNKSNRMFLFAYSIFDNKMVTNKTSSSYWKSHHLSHPSLQLAVTNAILKQKVIFDR